jgi:hypothetical protein
MVVVGSDRSNHDLRGAKATTMKTTVTIGIVMGAGCLFALATPLVAQEDQPLRYRSSRAQVTPGLPVAPSLRRRFQSEREIGEQPRPVRTMAPDRAGPPPQTPDLRTGSTPVSTPHRPKTKKLRAKTQGLSQPHGKNSDPSTESATNRKEHNPAAVSTPTRTTPVPVTIPSHAPAPIVAPAVSPPVYATPLERAAQMPGQPALQQTPSRLQRPTLNDLSEDERSRLHFAHQNAFQHDPNLAASRARYLNARKEFRQKLRDALLKADPSVQPILEKIRRDKPEDHD